MKKIPLPILEEFGPVRVFLDDLQEIARLLAHASRTDGGPGTVTIRAAGYELTASELDQIDGQKADRVEMMTSGGVSITFTKNEASAFIPRRYAEDVETRGAVALVRGYLDQNCQLGLSYLAARLGLVMFGAILLTRSVTAILAHYHLDSGWRSWIAETVNVAACVGVVTLMQRRKDPILLVPRSKHQTWWSTYKEKHSHSLVTALIAGVVGAGVGAVLDRLWLRCP